MAYSLFSYSVDSNSSFKEVYTKKYGITDEQFVNQCKMFLTKINQGNIEYNSVNTNKVFASVLHSCIIGVLSKVDITNEYIVFSPNQVKSAYDNNGDYSLVSDNMYECINQ